MRNVSITFQNNAESRPIVEAIVADNPEAKLEHLPALVKIDCAGRLVIRAESVSERIGREWDPQELHMTVISLSGNIDEDDDSFVLAWS